MKVRVEQQMHIIRRDVKIITLHTCAKTTISAYNDGIYKKYYGAAFKSETVPKVVA